MQTSRRVGYVRIKARNGLVESAEAGHLVLIEAERWHYATSWFRIKLRLSSGVTVITLTRVCRRRRSIGLRRGVYGYDTTSRNRGSRREL